MKLGPVLALSALVLSVGGVRAEVVRHAIPNSNFPIAQSVEVSGNATTYYVSGQVPPVVDKAADPKVRRPMAISRPRPSVSSTRSRASSTGSGSAWAT